MAQEKEPSPIESPREELSDEMKSTLREIILISIAQAMIDGAIEVGIKNFTFADAMKILKNPDQTINE